MQNKRSILWFVFAFSLVMLYDGWQRHLGHPTMFGMSMETPDAQANNAANKSAKSSDVAVPADAKVAASVKTETAIEANANVAQNGEIVKVKTDLLSLEFNTQGAVLQRAELLTQGDLTDKTKNMVLLDKSSERTYLAQTGLTGGTLPNHKTIYKLETNPRELADGKDLLDLVFVGESGGVQVKQTYTLKRGSYTIAVKHEVVNKGEQAVNPSLYLQLTPRPLRVRRFIVTKRNSKRLNLKRLQTTKKNVILKKVSRLGSQ